jgi:hypothetical protein
MNHDEYTYWLAARGLDLVTQSACRLGMPIVSGTERAASCGEPRRQIGMDEGLRVDSV